MQVLVNIGVVVEVETIKQALEKVDQAHLWGVVTALSVTPRPIPVVGQQGPTGATHADLAAAQARLAAKSSPPK